MLPECDGDDMRRAIPPIQATPRLDPQALQAFVIIARGAKFAEAAAVLGVTPGTVTKLIQGLEHDLGDVQLLIRSRQGHELTAAGQAAVRPAKAILSALHRMAKLVEDRPDE